MCCESNTFVHKGYGLDSVPSDMDHYRKQFV